MVATRSRTIQVVPALFIGLLEAAGKLPRLPSAIATLGIGGDQRQATLRECAALSWIVEMRGGVLDEYGIGDVLGVGAYRDVYDYHTSSDVREIVHVAGTRRAIVNLIEYMRAGAHEQGRRVLGVVDAMNLPMQRLLLRLDGRVTRVVIENRHE